LQETLNAIPAHVWYAAPTGSLMFVNSHAAHYLGLPADHPLRHGIDIGADWDAHISLLHPDDHEETRRVWSHCLKSDSAGEVNFRIRGAQGEYRWFISRAEPLRDDRNNLLFWLGINLDIEDRTRTEFFLTQAQRLAKAGSWAFNANGFEDWSPQLYDIHGLNPARRPPSTSEYLALVHPEDRESVSQLMEDVCVQQRPFDFTKRIVRADGAIRYVRCVGVPEPNSERFVGTGIDVTEQELLTKALKKSEDELRQILDFTPQFIIVFGPNRERLYANRTGLDYIGKTLEDWRSTPPGAPVHPDDREELALHWKQAALEGKPFEAEARLRRSDGIYRWWLGRFNPVFDDEDQILRWYLGCIDIDDRKKAEEGLKLENAALRQEINQALMFEQIVGISEPLQKVIVEVSKVARAESTVLILGETGTGKELIARAIHKRSKRASSAFIAVNCGAIPPSLIASELFGHEKGAFTGATQRRLGRFETANGGTIFLDEVGDLPFDAQIALLRVMQEREIERIGSGKHIPVNVRILAATHHDLQALVNEGRFRRDLFYRLNVVPIRVPPLRERADDIPLLVEYFIGRFAKKVGKTFKTIETRTLEALQAYDWPGNVRELQNVIERTITLSDSEIFSVEEAWLRREPASDASPTVALSGALLAHEKDAIEAALAQSNGRVSGSSGAAARLGVPTTTLESKIKRLGIDKYSFKRNRP
jgi:PAS domain S-box-containing protein